MTTMPLLYRASAVVAHASGLSKVYEQGETQVVALDQVTVDFRQGEFTAIMGPSGSGKSTLTAIARALASRPEIIFGDEPTGNLDSRAGAEVLGFLRNSVRELGQTVVMVTHDPVAASYADRVIFLADGRIVDEMLDPSADGVLDRMKAFDSKGRTS
ncbi:ATP-binding cassette domain-containing protein [Streptomyces sp. TRM75563]|uniref:ATP-binding cassette domain-containing protein n=1 Tax=Streptomyces sp. TRM75563 TaxID=2817418 RepID=UPI001F618433|nr:ATP-binding cassette domain-containing protein [Streptomyces sp. TRM75563]MCI4041658.1 ATP-binding cassette domain-containing protein [Streptomyces sp. TRM75563]